MRVGDPTICRSVAYLAVILATPQGAFAWGREGHQTIVIVAKHYMRPETAARMRELLAPESPEEASGWVDEYRHDHRETGPWHYIDIPLADSRMDLARECPSGDCVIAKTEQFLAVLKDPNAGNDANPDFSPRVWKGGALEAAEKHVAATLRRHAGVENTGHVAM